MVSKKYCSICVFKTRSVSFVRGSRHVQKLMKARGRLGEMFWLFRVFRFPNETLWCLWKLLFKQIVPFRTSSVNWVLALEPEQWTCFLTFHKGSGVRSLIRYPNSSSGSRCNQENVFYINIVFLSCSQTSRSPYRLEWGFLKKTVLGYRRKQKNRRPLQLRLQKRWSPPPPLPRKIPWIIGGWGTNYTLWLKHQHRNLQ